MGDAGQRLGAVGLKLAFLQDQLIVGQGGEHRACFHTVADIGLEAFDRQAFNLRRHQYFFDGGDHAIGQHPVGDFGFNRPRGNDRRWLGGCSWRFFRINCSGRQRGSGKKRQAEQQGNEIAHGRIRLRLGFERGLESHVANG